MSTRAKFRHSEPTGDHGDQVGPDCRKAQAQHPKHDNEGDEHAGASRESPQKDAGEGRAKAGERDDEPE